MCFSGGTPPSDMDAGPGSSDAGGPVAGCPEPDGHLRVVVRYQYGSSRVPLEGAQVDVSGPGGGGLQQTNSSGMTTYRNLRPGRYRIRVTSDGTTDGEGNAGVTSNTTTEARILVRPLGTIRGRVVDANNSDASTNGIEGANVSLEGTRRTANTNAQGQFEFTYIESGRHRIQATKPGYASNTVTVEANFRPQGVVNTTVPIQRITLEIYDIKTSTVVGGTTRDKIVGQKIELRVRTNPSGQSMSNIQWTIPGETVKRYNQTTSNGSITNLASSDLQQADVGFYWINGGRKSVQVRARVAGVELNVSGEFNLLRPTVNSFTITMSSVNVCAGNYLVAGTYLALYDPSLRRGGCQWDASVTAPDNGAGTVGFTQLVNVSRTETENSGTVYNASSNNAFVLDDAFGVQYSTRTIASNGTEILNGRDFSDSPGIELTSILRSMSVHDRFKLYLMYKPSGSDSIWVTLSMIQWSWRGQTTRIGAPTSTGNNWNPASNTSVSPSSTGNGSNSTELPTWNSNTSSISWV